MKGHKGVYQFLSIPYGRKGYDHEVMTTGTFTTSPCNGSTECSFTHFSVITSDCSERQSCYRGTGVDGRKNTEKNRESSVDNRELAENSFNESNRNRSREKRWSDCSMSSDSSTKSLDQRQADFLNTDILGHVTNNMHDFVFNDDDNNVCM